MGGRVSLIRLKGGTGGYLEGRVVNYPIFPDFPPLAKEGNCSPGSKGTSRGTGRERFREDGRGGAVPYFDRGGPSGGLKKHLGNLPRGACWLVTLSRPSPWKTGGAAPCGSGGRRGGDVYREIKPWTFPKGPAFFGNPSGFGTPGFHGLRREGRGTPSDTGHGRSV